MMRWMLASLLLGLLGLVSALSASGSQLLVVLDQESDKAKYSQFWAGLEGNHPPQHRPSVATGPIS